jgi:hypothetical protein
VPWRGGVRNIIILHTHIILSQHCTNNFSLHTTRYSHATPSWTKKHLFLLSFVPVYWHVLLFPLCFAQWRIENFYMVFPYTVKERVIKTGISLVVQICINCLNKRCSRSILQLLQSRCPKQVQISGLGTWTRHSNVQTYGMLTQKWLFSPAYGYKVGTSGNALKCDIILPALLLEYLQGSLFISIYHTQLEL